MRRLRVEVLVVLWLAAVAHSTYGSSIIQQALDAIGWSGADTDTVLPSVPIIQPAEDNVETMSASLRDRLRSAMDRRLAALRSSLRHHSELRWNESAAASEDRTQHPPVQRQLDSAPHSRSKRAHPVRMALTRDETGVGVLEGPDAVQKLWSIPAVGAQHLHLFSDAGTVYALAAFGNNTYNGSLYRLQPDGEWSVQQRFSSLGTLGFTSFERNGSRYVVGAEYNCISNRVDKRGPILYQLHDGSLHYRHALPQIYPTDIDIRQHFDTTYIGVASYRGLTEDGRATHHVHSSVFKWADGNFKAVTFPTQGARDMEHFQIQNHIYIAVANHRNDEGEPWSAPPGSANDRQSVNDLMASVVHPKFKLNWVNDKEQSRVQQRLERECKEGTNCGSNDENNKDDLWTSGKKGNRNIYSEILRYSLATGRYRSFQRILTHGAVRVRHFSWGSGVGAEHFIVIANQMDMAAGDEVPEYRVNSIIYKFHGNQFLPFQCVPTVRVQDVTPVWGTSDEFVLALVDSEGLKLYQYTGWRFILTTVIETQTPGLPVALDTFTYQNYAHISVGGALATDDTPSVYRLQFTRRHDLSRQHDALQKWCNRTRALVVSATSRYQRLTYRVHRAPKVHQDISFQSLRVLAANGTATVDNIHVDEMLMTGNLTLNSGLLGGIREMGESAQIGLSLLRGINSQLAQGAVRTDQHYRFSEEVNIDGSLSVKTVAIRDLRANSLNGISNMQQFLQHVIWLRKDNIISNTHLRFKSVVIAQHTTLNATALSGLDPGFFITLSGDHTIFANKTIRGDVRTHLVHALTINGRPVGPDSFIIQGHLPDGARRLYQVTVHQLWTDIINGININNVLHNYLPVNSSVFPACEFRSAVYIRSLTATRLNAVSLQDLFQFALTSSGGQTVSGRWSIGTLQVIDLTLEGTLNGVRVPDDLIQIHRPDLIYSLQQLTLTTLSVQQLTVSQQLGPINVVDGLLQLLLVSGNQTVTGNKSFGQLCVHSDWTVTGQVNGVTLSVDVLQQQMEQHATIIFGNKTVLGRVQFNGDLIVGGTVNGLRFPAVLNSYLPLNATILPPIECTGDVQLLGGVTTDHINGISPADWVRSDGTEQAVSAAKFFSQVSAASGLHFDKLNNISVSELYAGVLRIRGDQTVHGPLMFVTDLQLDNVTADHVTWVGHDLATAVTITGNHTITGTKTYSQDVLLSNLRVDQLWVGGLIDTVNLTSLLASSTDLFNRSYVLLSGTQTFSERVSIARLRLNLSGDADAGTSPLLLSLLAAPVSQHHIHTDIVFRGDVSVDRLQFEGSMDGVSADVFGVDWLTTDGGQTFKPTALLQSGHNVSVTSLILMGGATLNGQTASQLLDDVISVSGPGDIVINGDVYIASLVSDSVTVESLQDNMTNIVRLDQPNIFSSSVAFSGRVEVAGAVSFSSINGYNITDLCGSVRLRTEFNSLSELNVTGDVTVEDADRLAVTTLNGIDMASVEQTYWFSDLNQTLTGRVHLQEPHFNSLIAQSVLAGEPPESVNLQSYLQNYWSRRRPTVIHGNVTFNSDVVAEQLTVNNHLTVEGDLNGRNLNMLYSMALTKAGGVVTGNWNISQMLVTGDLNATWINGLRPSSFIGSSETIIVTEPNVLIHSLQVEGDLVLPERGTVFDHDVSSAFNISNFLLKEGSFVIDSDVLFSSELVTFEQPLTIASTVNGVEISSSTLLTKSGDQTILGDVTISSGSTSSSDCFTAAILSSNISNVNLDRLVNDAVRVNDSYRVTGNWTFINTPAVIHSAPSDNRSIQALIQLQSAAESALTFLRTAAETNSSERAYLETPSAIYSALKSAATPAPLYLRHYESSQRWESAVVLLVPVSVNDAPPEVMVAVWDQKVRLLHWSGHTEPGLWTDGVTYQDVSAVSWAAGLQIASNGLYIAVSRLVQSTSLQGAPDTYDVHTWNGNATVPDAVAVNYIFGYHRGQLERYQYLTASKSVDVKTFRPTADRDCFLFVNFLGAGSPLVCHGGHSEGFRLHQLLPTRDARQASVYSLDEAGRGACVAIAGAAVQLWCWDSTADQLQLAQTLSVAATTLDTARLDGTLVLALAHAGSPKLHGLVQIYSYNVTTDSFTHAQTVAAALADGVMTVQLLVLPSSELILVTLSRGGHVTYLPYRGHAWFQQPGGGLLTPGAVTLTAYNLPDGVSQLAVAGRPQTEMFSMKTSYPAAVYTARFMGDPW